MSSLLELKKAIQAEQVSQAGRTTLIWGPPRTGKTRWAATIAKAPSIKRVFFLDYENGIETVIHAKDKDGSPYFTDEELAKIIPVRIPDLPENFLAFKTTDALFKSRHRTVNIVGDPLDDKVGEIRRKEHTPQPTDITITPDMWCPETAFVLDTIGQIGNSALNLAEHEKPDAKDKRQWYMDATHWLNNLFSYIQACPAYVIACTHVLENEIVESRDKSGNPLRTRYEYYPLCLSKNYSMNVGKYFGSIIYRWIELNKFAHLSSPIKKSGIQAGTRTGIDVSTSLDMTLPEVLKLMQQQVEAAATAEATAKPSLAKRLGK